MMFCPLNYIHSHPACTEEYRALYCTEEYCAWYDEKHKQCIVKLLASLYSEKMITEIKTQNNFAQMQQKIAENDIFDILFPQAMSRGDQNGN